MTTMRTTLSAAGETITFDALLSEEATEDAEVSAYEVEEGADVADHVRQKNARLSVGIVFTDSPLDDIPLEGRAASLYARLLAFKQAGTLVTLTTRLQTYTDYLITSLAATRDSKSGGSVPIALELERLRFAQTETVEVPANLLAPKVKNSGQAGNDAGAQSAKDASSSIIAAEAKTPAPRRSTAKEALGALGSLF